MSDAQKVDLSQIRGDWNFHINFLANAIHQTLIRAEKLWGTVGKDANDPAIGQLIDKLADCWSRLQATGNKQRAIDVTSPILDEFIKLNGQTKAPCDALEVARNLSGSASIYDLPLEQFTEAVRQVRSFCEDLEMMREQRPT